MAKEFKEEFSNAVSNLNIDFDWQPTTDQSDILDPLDKVIDKYKDHPSIKKIKEKVQVTEPFKFEKVSEPNVLDLIADFNIKKATSYDTIPGKSF